MLILLLVLTLWIIIVGSVKFISCHLRSEPDHVNIPLCEFVFDWVRKRLTFWRVHFGIRPLTPSHKKKQKHKKLNISNWNHICTLQTTYSPYCNWGPPQNVHSVVLMDIRHCYTYQDSRALVQIVQMHHILQKKKQNKREHNGKGNCFL